MTRSLSKDIIRDIVKKQMIAENFELRSCSEYCKDIPFAGLKSILASGTVGIVFTSCLHLARDRTPENIIHNGIISKVPMISTFSVFEFGINFAATKFIGLNRSTRAIDITSAAVSGGICGFIYGRNKGTSIIFGSFCGAAYGALRRRIFDLISLSSD